MNKSAANIKMVKETRQDAGYNNLESFSYSGIDDEQPPSPILSKMFTPKQKTVKHDGLLTTEETISQEFPTPLAHLDFHDCEPTKMPLHVIQHQPKYLLPPYCSEEFNKLSIHDRMGKLKVYHKSTEKQFYQFQRKSIYPAKWGNPITSSVKFNGCLLKSNARDDVCDNSFEAETPEEVYTSRAGRQLKRKNYSESREIESKKHKQLPKSPPLELEILSDPRVEVDANRNNETIKPNVELPSSSTSVLFTPSPKPKPKKRTNEEIYARSSLFSDSPPKTRRQKIENSLREQEKKLQKKEPAPQEEETVLRIVPPINGKRGKRQQSYQVVKRDPMPKYMHQPKSDSDSDEPIEVLPAENRTKCPICARSFAIEEIEQHASECGLTSMEIEDTPPPDGSAMACCICDKMLQITEYELHIKKCIAKDRKKCYS